MENGILEVDRIILEERAHIYIDDTTAIDTLRINNALAYQLRRNRSRALAIVATEQASSRSVIPSLSRDLMHDR